MKKHAIIEFTVEGCGQFPFDMLRYDSCWPYQQEDALQLGYNGGRDTNIQRRRVVLQGIQEPTKGRWDSFLWRVVAMGVERDQALTSDKLEDRT